MNASGTLFTADEVAKLFGVRRSTVVNWAAARRINSIKTPGGHLRFPAAEVRALLSGTPAT